MLLDTDMLQTDIHTQDAYLQACTKLGTFIVVQHLELTVINYLTEFLLSYLLLVLAYWENNT